ncbi:hypothetical protein [Actinomycetospora callitridis]|uniref:hypothetical protein n=1 Tax=Actinomycetospora callitridis TaxID=913944 RepID=UPI0023672A30|nr:hypothetical protein [Actinomycetospora callitridis]MDD7917411.1 hypothetical protein [Actinomycetospora callitridis]
MISGRSGWSGWSERFTESGHLALDAVVAFVDEELPPGPAHRAAAHVDRCLTCAAEVAAQRQARRRVRAAGDPCVPSSLFSTLCSIPDVAPLPGAPAGLAVAADGTLVVPAQAGRTADTPDTADVTGGVTKTGRSRWGRRRTLGLPVAVSSGVVVGAAALAAFAGPAVVAGTAPAAPGSVAPRVTPTAAAAQLATRDTDSASDSARDAVRHEGPSRPASAPHGPGAP